MTRIALVRRRARAHVTPGPFPAREGEPERPEGSLPEGRCMRGCWNYERVERILPRGRPCGAYNTRRRA